MSTVWQIKTHQSIMWSHDSLVNLEVRGATTQALDIDTPFLRVQMERPKSTVLAGQLNRVDMLISAVVSCTRITFRVFVRHWGSQGIENSSGCNIFGGNKDDGFSLALDLQFLQMI